MTQQILSAGGLELVVDAARGGSIMAFRQRGFDLMRPWDGVTEDPRAYASFPLVPFSGRIDHASFRFNGRSYALAANFPPEPHAIHGDGWTSPWQVVAADTASAELELIHDAPGDVLRYRATQIFWLYPDHLEIAMSLTNRGPEPMPFGLGHHPYFVDRDQARLSAQVSGVWLTDDLNVPRQLESVPPLWSFRQDRPVDELVLDHVFQGWNGKARVDWPEAGRALVIEGDELYRHLVVYVPPGRPFFCVEPVSMIGDGFNLLTDGVKDTGVRVLAPGESMRGSMYFRPVAAS
jgi:aldose 1-epimerase